MRVALGQFNSGSDKAANLARIDSLAASAAAGGADLLLLPEAAMVRFGPPAVDLTADAEPLDGPFADGLRALADRHGIAVVAGLFESIPDSPLVYNTVLAVGPDGRDLGAYRKIHLYDAFGLRESERFAPGPGAPLTFTAGGLTCGVMTCYDIRFPELARHLVDRGAQLLLVPTAWAHGVLKEDHWLLLARARAVENTVYLAGAAQCGGIYSGRSVLVDPMGVAVAAAGEVDALVQGEVDPARIAAVRAKLPSLAHRRPEVYGAWEAPVGRS